MSLKNSFKRVKVAFRSLPAAFTGWPNRSLRLRLMLWYGGLMLLGLTCFGLLVLFLASSAINSNSKNAVNGATQLATVSLQQTLLSQSPYWPLRLQLKALDAYSTPGIIIEAFDAQNNILYSSDINSPLILNNSTIQTVQQTGKAVWYNTSVDGERALVEVTGIYAPDLQGQQGKGPFIGVLLVAKSLHDANETLLLLQSYLLLTGILMLILFLGCGWAIVGYALRPLAALVKTASSIAGAIAYGKRVEHLHQRVQRPRGKDEMAQVVDAFNNMLSSIESATTVQRRFIADASHELRAPLTTIQGNLAFLIRYIEDIPPSERHIMLADAHGETLRLANLVDELLLLARADANIGQVSQTTLPAPIVELDSVLLKLVRQMRRRLEIEGSAPKIVIGGIEPVRVRGDEESLRRIMIILLDNAIKYTRAEGENDEGRVIVAIERSGNEAVLRVSDTGIGIESKDLPHIFERFYRADLARSREGTGLGLAIAQTLVEQLNGRITAESQPGQGSTFRVWLDLA